MAEDFSITVDTSRWSWQVEKLKAALPEELQPKVLEYQAGQFVRTMFNFPPKFGKSAKRIERSMTQAVTPLTKRKLWHLLGNSPRLRKRLEQLGITPTGNGNISQRAARALSDPGGIFERTKLNEWREVPGGELKTHIKAQQDNYGRVSRRKPFFTSDVAAFKALYNVELKARGLLKAGWATAAAALGVNIPSYIANQARWGEFENNARSPNTPRVLMMNNAVKLPDYNNEVERALVIRTEAMQRQLTAVLMGKAVNLGFATVGGESWNGDEDVPLEDDGGNGVIPDFELLT